MKYSRCNSIDKDWSQITFGCWQLAKSDGWGDYTTPDEAEAAVKTALDCGITAYDTAEGYGDGESERRLGKALGSQKDDVIIISKIWPDAELTKAAYTERLDNTLRALNRDYVDLYLMHWPDESLNSKENSQRFVDLMVQLRDSGKTKTIGLSNFHENNLKLLGSNIDQFVVNQVPYSLLEPEYSGPETQICSKHNLGFMAYSPTAKGLLARPMTNTDLNIPTRKNDELFAPPLFEHTQIVFDALLAIGLELSCSPAEVAFAWVLRQPNMLTAIMGTKKPDQVIQNAKATEVTLTDKHMRELTALSQHFAKLK